jgi:hypothetical protein
MSTLYALLEQARAARARLEQERASVDHPRGVVVIYDLETRQPLPGYEPNPDAEYHCWIPHNGRDER